MVVEALLVAIYLVSNLRYIQSVLYESGVGTASGASECKATDISRVLSQLKPFIVRTKDGVR
jgi:hypothetical protein